MRVVSYTRKARNIPSTEKEVPITEQNKAIMEYLKARGWKLDEKYSDRRHEASADEDFNRLLNDGINRRFDLVIVFSVTYFGPIFGKAYEVMYETFYRAGIHFVLVNDNICSKDCTPNSIAELFASFRQNYITASIRKAKGIGNKEKTLASTQETRRLPPPNLFAGRLFRKETGDVISQEVLDAERKEYVYFINDRKDYLRKETIAAAMKEALLKEIELAQRIGRELNSGDIQKHFDLLQSEKIAEARAVFQHQIEVSMERFSLLRSGKKREDADVAALEKRFAELDGDLSAIISELDEIEKRLSKENRWLKAFSDLILPEDFNHQYVYRWVKSILIDDSGTMEFHLRYEDEKEYLLGSVED